MSEIVIRLIDRALERPVSNVKIGLEAETEEGQWRPVGRGLTNDEGCLALVRLAAPPASRLLGAASTHYRLTCALGVYFARCGTPGVFPELWVHFEDDGRGSALRLRIDVAPGAYAVSREG